MPEQGVSRPPQDTTLRDILYVLFRHKKKAVGFFLATVAFVTAYSFLASEVFLSEAKLLLRVGRESVGLDPTVTTGETIALAQTRESELNSELAILRSRDLAEKVVETIGVERILAPRGVETLPDPSLVGEARNLVRATRRRWQENVSDAESVLERLDLFDRLQARSRAVQTVLSNLHVNVYKRSSIIELSFECENGTLGRYVLQTLIQFYLEKHMEVHRNNASYAFFEREITRIRDDLTRVESELEDVANRVHVPSPEALQANLAHRLVELQTELAASENRREAESARAVALRRSLADQPERIVTQETSGLEYDPYEELRGRIDALELREKELLTRYTETSVPVTRLREELEEARALLATRTRDRSETVTGVNRIRQTGETSLLQAEAEQASQHARSTVLQRQIDALRSEVKTLNAFRLRWDRLERERVLLEKMLKEYTLKQEQARIERSLQEQRISNVGIVQQPTQPTRPIRPRKMRNIAFSLILGAVGALLLAFLAESLDRTFRTTEAVEEKLGVSVFAAIPALRREAGKALLGVPWRSTAAALEAFQQLRRRRQRTSPTDRREALRAFFRRWGRRRWPPAPVHAPEHVRRCFETLRDRIILTGLGHEHGKNCVGVVSCHPGEGVTTVSANLATVLARKSPRRVLLVDANVQQRRIHEIFDLKVENGLLDVLLCGGDWRKAVVASPVDNLDIMPVEDLPFEFAWLTQLQELNPLLDAWRAEYQFVILDLPALQLEQSVARLTEFLDGILLVVGAEQIRYEAALRGRALLDRSPLIGAVLNRRRYPIPGWIAQWL